jgi:hypothetical protein
MFQHVEMSGSRTRSCLRGVFAAGCVLAEVLLYGCGRGDFLSEPRRQRKDIDARNN